MGPAFMIYSWRDDVTRVSCSLIGRKFVTVFNFPTRGATSDGVRGPQPWEEARTTEWAPEKWSELEEEWGKVPEGHVYLLFFISSTNYIYF